MYICFFLSQIHQKLISPWLVYFLQLFLMVMGYIYTKFHVMIGKVCRQVIKLVFGFYSYMPRTEQRSKILDTDFQETRPPQWISLT